MTLRSYLTPTLMTLVLGTSLSVLTPTQDVFGAKETSSHKTSQKVTSKSKTEKSSSDTSKKSIVAPKDTTASTSQNLPNNNVFQTGTSTLDKTIMNDETYMNDAVLSGNNAEALAYQKKLHAIDPTQTFGFTENPAPSQNSGTAAVQNPTPQQGGIVEQQQ